MSATTAPAPSTVTSTTAPTPSRTRKTLVLIAAALVVVAANAIVATAALQAGANAAFPALAIYVYGPLSVIGLLAAYLGWRIIRSRAAHPAAVLKVVVPVLTVLSFVPDTILLVTGFIPNSSATAVVGLALMHLVVVAVAIPVFRSIAPVR